MENNKRHNIYLFLFIAAYTVLAIWFGYFVERTDTATLIILYTGLLVPYLLIWSLSKHMGIWKPVLIGAIVLRVCLLFSTPHLSDDHYRYIWDGVLTSQGYETYRQTPDDFVVGRPNTVNEPLYNELNSKQFYTVYPPVSQVFFAVAAYLGNGDIYWSTFWLKCIGLLFELGSMLLLVALLTKAGITARSNLAGYSFNPLVVMELTGNVHFEVAMIFFSLLCLWLLVKQWHRLAGLALASAVGVKLWPVLFVPFVIKQTGFGTKTRNLVLGLTIGGVLMFIPFWFEGLLDNMLLSVRLYVQYFEFNASLYFLFRAFVEGQFSYELFESLRTWFPALLLGILGIYWFVSNSKLNLAKPFAVVVLLYFVFATTVHPWYITPLVALGVLAGLRFPIVWAALLPFTYLAYANEPAALSPWLITVEYLVVFSFALFELLILPSKKFKRWLQNHYLIRAEIKWQRIQSLLKQDTKILDVGTGNGALVHLLRTKGYSVETLDIVDKSAFNDVKPTIYNGDAFPFNDKIFDTVIIITVLHHTPNPAAILKEAKRVGKELIVMEDIYQNNLQKWVTWFTDSLVNWEFWGHPHTNKADAEWKLAYNALGANLNYEKQERFLALFRQVTYRLSFDKKGRETI